MKCKECNKFIKPILVCCVVIQFDMCEPCEKILQFNKKRKT